MKKNLHTMFYIIRHGQTEWNAKKLLQGQTDIPLNKNGIKQAKALKEKLKDIKFDFIFSSDLKRATKTIEPIALMHKLAIQTTHLLRERNFGRLQGTPTLVFSEFQKEFEALTEQDKFKYKSYPEIESDEQIVSRAITFLREVAIAYPNKTILIATHGGVIHSLLIHLGYFTYAKNNERHIKNTTILKLTTDGVDFKILEVDGIERV